MAYDDKPKARKKSGMTDSELSALLEAEQNSALGYLGGDGYPVWGRLPATRTHTVAWALICGGGIAVFTSHGDWSRWGLLSPHQYTGARWETWSEGNSWL